MPNLLLVMMLLLAGCQAAQQSSFAMTLPVTATVGQVVVRSTLVPTANLAPSRTPTLPPTATYTPSPTATATLTPTITLSPTVTLSPTPAPTRTPISSATPTDPSTDPNYTPPPTWTPPPANPAAQIADHYAFGRPIASSGVDWVDRVYPYGATAGGTFATHHGVEFVNPTGTPILAVGDGIIYYAGDDLATQFGPNTDFYGNLVVIQHNVTDADGQMVYTLYGHMNTVDVQAGQPIRRGDRVGTVGASGIALGAHLHFEVRVGEPTNYNATRNPELWIRPYPTFGTLAGIVTDADGNRLYSAPVRVESLDISRYTWSYNDDTVDPDTTFNENFVLGDLPANYYEVTVSDNGRVRFRQIVYVYPNRTTWLNIVLNR
jgi:murein DD-endopeptidase MepM/ murein hydrolase activator NlpD